ERPGWRTPGGRGSLGRPGLGRLLGLRLLSLRFGSGGVTSGDLPRLYRIGAGWRHEHRLAVIAQLLDALPDVGERPVPAVLGRAGEVHARVPAPGQLLDAADVHHAVVP